MKFLDFKSKFEKKEVIQYDHCCSDKPLVSVCVQTYNHENYIEQCLEGILKQKTDFQYEILIGEDNSNDKTREICIRYAEQYPDKIRLFLHHRENNISINGKPTGRFNFLYNIYQTRGKYIAFCEGDDFWQLHNKLTLQVQFLEKNLEYSGCHSDYSIIDETNNIKSISGINKKNRKDLTHLDILRYKPPRTLTVCMRKSLIIDKIDNLFIEVSNGDRLLFSVIGKYGQIKYLDYPTGVYRQHKGGVWTSLNKKKRLYQQLDTATKIKKYFNTKDEVKAINVRLSESCKVLYKVFLREGKYFLAGWYFLKFIIYNENRLDLVGKLISKIRSLYIINFSFAICSLLLVR